MENAPTAGTGMGQTGISKNEKGENADGSHEQCKLLLIMVLCQSKMLNITMWVLNFPSFFWCVCMTYSFSLSKGIQTLVYFFCLFVLC